MRRKIPELYDYLRPYQRKGVREIEARNGRALLADEPGLGKTIQAVAWLATRPELRPAVIICPAVAKHHWKAQAEKWLPNDSVQVLSGMTPTGIKDSSIIIANYDILANDMIEVDGNFCYLNFPQYGEMRSPSKTRFEVPFSGWMDALAEVTPAVMILDEVHYAKNADAKRTKAIKKLASKWIKHLIGISGTPITNRPSEFFNTIKWINPNLFKNEWSFKMRYCGAKHNGYGWQFNGATNTKELHNILTKDNGVMIRRTKKEVYEDLPAKTRMIVPLEITNRVEYIRADRDFKAYLRGEGREDSSANYLVKLEALKQIAVKGKMKEAISWIEDFLDTGEKLVVFCEHKKTVDEVMKKFGKIAVKVVGGVSTELRKQAEHEFQTNDKIRLFVGNIDAAGVSLTLTASSNVAMLELPDTPGGLTQCEDRVYGRVNDPHGANVYFLVALETKEEDIAAMLDEKAKNLSAVLDGKDVEAGSMITELIKKWRKENDGI